MDYTYTPPPDKANDGWMSHRLSIFVDTENRDSFWKFLENYCGPKGQDWRVAKKQARYIWGDEAIDLRFRFKKHAMVVKLQWIEDEDPQKKIFDQMKAMAAKFSSIQLQNRTSRSPNLYFPTNTGKSLYPWYTKQLTTPVILDYESKISLRGIEKMLGIRGRHGRWAIDDYEEKPKPTSFIEKCRSRGDTISTPAMIEARLAGSTSLPVLYEVRPDERRETGSDRTSG